MGVNGVSSIDQPTATSEPIVLGGSGNVKETCTAEQIQQAHAFLTAMLHQGLNTITGNACPKITVSTDSVNVVNYESTQLIGEGERINLFLNYLPITGEYAVTQPVYINLSLSGEKKFTGTSRTPPAVSVPNAQAKIAALRVEAERILAEPEKK